MRVRILFLALALTLTQTPVIANPTSKCTKACTPAIGPAGGYMYKYVAGKQQRKDITGKWQKRDQRSESAFDPIRVAAYKSIYSLAVDPKISNFKLEYTVKPGYPKEIERVLKMQLEKTLSRFSPLLSEAKETKIFLITDKDKNWAKTDLTRIVPENEYIGGLEILDWYNTKQRFFQRGGTGGGMAGYPVEKGFAFYLGHTSTYATLETYWPEVPPHEATHMLQGILANGFASDYPEGHPKAKWHGHLVEGSANTLGMALGFESLGWYSDEMDRILKRDIESFRSWKKMANVDDAVAFIKAIEERTDDKNSSFSYSAGQVVWEYFVGKYGVNKFVELLRNIPKTEDFNANLKATIGKDREAFYQEAGEYLLKNWQRLSK
jgi:hypothetical protein